MFMYVYTCVAYIRVYVRTDVYAHTHTHLMRKRANKHTVI